MDKATTMVDKRKCVHPARVNLTKISKFEITYAHKQIYTSEYSLFTYTPPPF